MKTQIEKRAARGFVDYAALAITTFGVGYLPGAPGTFGSALGVAIYLGADEAARRIAQTFPASAAAVLALEHSIIAAALAAFILIGIWASSRAIDILGNTDPSEAVVDEVMGQLVTFCFVPFALSWPLIIAGFALFRLFDIWKPYPIDELQVLPGGIGVCADDLVAGVYAGVCLAVIHAVTLFV
jgi:phosphatidylglycerophosphatase A